MIYNIKTRELKTDNGTLLKKLDCPLHKEWNQLDVIPNDTSKRRCQSCKKFVVNMEGKSDRYAELFFQQLPRCCVYIPQKSRNIRLEGYKSWPEADPCPFRRIRTARDPNAINQGVREGFWPLVKRVKPSPEIVSWIKVYQNKETGEIKVVGDLRESMSPPWEVVVERFSFYRSPFQSPLAAYLLPSDLQVGERVFLVDLIEDLIGESWQDNNSRLDSAYAIWNGEDFEIQWDERTDTHHLLG